MKESSESKKQEQEKREQETEEAIERLRKEFGQGLTGRYGLVNFFEEDGKICWWQVTDWQIIDGWVSCILHSFLDGHANKRMVIPVHRIHEITSYQYDDDWRQAIDERMEKERSHGKEQEKQQPPEADRKSPRKPRKPKPKLPTNEPLMRLSDGRKGN